MNKRIIHLLALGVTVAITAQSVKALNKKTDEHDDHVDLSKNEKIDWQSIVSKYLNN
jgi:hypothetical protein